MQSRVFLRSEFFLVVKIFFHRQFDYHAMSIIDRCFDNDEYFGVELLKQPALAFDNVDPLKIAQEADCRIFLASKCVQRHLDNQWFGNINYKRRAINFRVRKTTESLVLSDFNVYFQVFLVTLLFPLLPVFSIFLPYVQERKEVCFDFGDAIPYCVYIER